MEPRQGRRLFVGADGADLQPIGWLGDPVSDRLRRTRAGQLLRDADGDDDLAE
jgi:hypothetical protein